MHTLICLTIFSKHGKAEFTCHMWDTCHERKKRFVGRLCCDLYKSCSLHEVIKIISFLCGPPLTTTSFYQKWDSQSSPQNVLPGFLMPIICSIAHTSGVIFSSCMSCTANGGEDSFSFSFPKLPELSEIMDSKD